MRRFIPLVGLLAACQTQSKPSAPLTQACSGTAGLAVEAVGLRQAKGELMCSLYDAADGFPGSADAAVALTSATVGPDGACCQFGERPAGTYAIAVMHDVDGNGVLTTNGLGIPQEGFGASNDAKNRGTSPPRFDDAAFTHVGGDRVLDLTMRYMAGPPKSQSTPGLARAADGSCSDTDLAALEFAGPGWEAGALTGEAQDEYFVHTTVLILRTDAEAQRRFQALNARMLKDLQTAPGLVGLTVGGSERCGYARTLGVWESERAMRTFVYGNDAHIEAMEAFPKVAIQGKTTHWMAPAADLPPSWEDARARLVDAPVVPGHRPDGS